MRLRTVFVTDGDVRRYRHAPLAASVSCVGRPPPHQPGPISQSLARQAAGSTCTTRASLPSCRHFTTDCPVFGVFRQALSPRPRAGESTAGPSCSRGPRTRTASSRGCPGTGALSGKIRHTIGGRAGSERRAPAGPVRCAGLAEVGATRRRPVRRRRSRVGCRAGVVVARGGWLRSLMDAGPASGGGGRRERARARRLGGSGRGAGGACDRACQRRGAALAATSALVTFDFGSTRPTSWSPWPTAATACWRPARRAARIDRWAFSATHSNRSYNAPATAVPTSIARVGACFAGGMSARPSPAARAR